MAEPSYFRRVIRIEAADSPNVQAGSEIVPGLLTKEEYAHRLATWDEVRKEIGLFARFYMGAQLLLFPPDWLDKAEANWSLIRHSQRQAKAIGVDPGEGGANSSWSVVDDLGVIEMRSEKTPDTTDVTDITIELMEQHKVSAERVMFDSGGGGKEHADRLRKGVTYGGSFKRHDVRMVGFGAKVSLEPKRGLRMLEEKKDVREDAYAYLNRRAEMYHQLSQLLDPALNRANGLPGFAIPPGITTGNARCHVHGGQCLRAQLAVMPKMTDKEGRYKLPPKNKQDATSKERSLSDMIGHSPDELDSLVLAVHSMLSKARRVTAGAF